MDSVISEWWLQLLKERKCSNTSKVVKTIYSYPVEVQKHARMYIADHIRDTILNVMQHKDLKKKMDLCAAINGCFDNFSHAADGVNIAFNEIIKFIDLSIEECRNMLSMKDCAQMKKTKWIELIHHLGRVLVLVLKLRRPLKFEEKDFDLPEIAFYDKRVLVGLAYKISHLVKVKEMLMDTKCTLAMASVLIREVLVGKKEKLAEYQKKFLATLPESIDEKEYELNVYKFLLGNAILNTWSGILVDPISIHSYLKFFIQLCESYSSDTGIILNLSRTLLLLIRNECFHDFMTDKLIKKNDLVKPLLSCVYMLLDHPVPCVRHASKDFPRVLACYEEFQPSMVNSLPTMLIDKRCYYACVGALADEVGSQSLFASDDSLKENLFLGLLDPALVNYAIDALKSIIVGDYLIEANFSMWCERWIVSLFNSFSKVRSTVASDIEKLLQNLLVTYPATIYFIIKKWYKPTNDQELHYIMIALKVYNKLSIKYQEEAGIRLASRSVFHETRWKGIISERLLRYCLNNNDDDLRVSALALVVESVKTTEKYTEQDFALIQCSLKYNLNNQQPATRQKFLALMKKMLTRYVDSLAVLERSAATKSTAETSQDRRIYLAFQEWFIDFCFSNIYETANFSRLYTILTVMLDYVGLVKDFKIDDSDVDEYWRRLLVPIRSTYEENKKLGVLLIKKMNILKLYRDNRLIKSIFKKAYDLCGKIEPPNVLTGAYLIQTLLEYPLLSEALEGFLPKNPTYTVEQLVVVLLSNKLEKQIRAAEKSLIRAMMTNPMYGVLFAIRIILQETDLSLVSDAPESEHQMEIQRSWSEILKRLIELSFRMIEVVSCVVNSSSPEGHLPSDFQSNLDSVFEHNYLPMEAEYEEPEEVDQADVEEAASGIQEMALNVPEPMPKTRTDILQDCRKFMRRYNNVFLKHGTSRSFTEQNATEFKDLLKECTKLISEVDEIQERSFQENTCLTCLKTMESELKKCLKVYDSYSHRRGKPTAQILLLCSWRSIKEACLFLGDLVSKLPLKMWIESELITEEMLITIGLKLRTLLCEVKHRGAFEHAYVGFTNLVTVFLTCPIKNLNDLPQKWLEEILSEIKRPKECQQLNFCSSRRSAGLPFLVQAIICSEVKCTNSAKVNTFEIAMTNLLDAAEVSGPEESKIHSLNILRALFKHALLGEHVAPYVSQGVMVAIRGCRSSSWGIRNSACLLFSALTIRIFGVARDKDALSKKNRMTARHFFQRYPDLYEFFLNEMELAFEYTVRDTQSMSAFPSPQPHLFLILLTLGRLYPSPTEDKADIDFSEFLPFIDASCSHPSYKIRELGARALVPLINSDTYIQALEARFSSLKSEFRDYNRLQGTLFQIKTILLEMCDRKKLFDESIRENAEKWITNTNSILDVTQNSAPYLIKIVYVQILHLIFKVEISLGEKLFDVLNEKELVDFLGGHYEIQEETPGRAAYLETLHFVKFDIGAHIWLEFGNSDCMIGSVVSMLNNEIDEVQILGLAFLKYITSLRYDNIEEEEEPLLITVSFQDLFCIEDENQFKRIAMEVYSHEAVVTFIKESIVPLFNNSKKSSLLYKMTNKLKLSVFSNFLLKGLITPRDIEILCLLNKIQGPVMDSLSDIIKCHSTDVSVAAFTCYGVLFFDKLKSGVELEPSMVSYFTKLLFSFCDRNADVKQRMAACEIFYKYYDFFIHNFFKTDSRAMSIWMLPVKLLGDEEPMVRRRALELVYMYQGFCRENYRHRRLNWEFEDIYLSQLTGTPYKAQESLLDCYISLIDRDELIHLFVPMVAFMLTAYINTINCEHTSKQNEDGVFEKGNPNPFCEDMTFGKLIYNKLKQFRVFLRIAFARGFDETHVDCLKEFFPSIILPIFPERLHDFVVEIVNIIIDGNPEEDLSPVSFLTTYSSDLVDLCGL